MVVCAPCDWVTVTVEVELTVDVTLTVEVTLTVVGTVTVCVRVTVCVPVVGEVLVLEEVLVVGEVLVVVEVLVAVVVGGVLEVVEPVTLKSLKPEFMWYVPTPTYPLEYVASVALIVYWLFQFAVMVEPTVVTVRVKVPVGLICPIS